MLCGSGLLGSWVLLLAQVPSESYLLQGRLRCGDESSHTEEVGGTSQRSSVGFVPSFRSLLPSSHSESMAFKVRRTGFPPALGLWEEIGTQRVLFTC